MYTNNMQVLVSGAVAYDRIMDFPGRFGDHILPKHIHQLNVSFNVDDIRQEFGGTAGNIAYNLQLHGIQPRLVCRAGSDFGIYEKWLHKHTISTKHIRFEDTPTATATMITDKDDNQISGFYQGAMGKPYGVFPAQLFSGVDMAIISPGNVTDMDRLPRELYRKKVLYFFDPGQTIPVLSAATLRRGIQHALGLFGNDYEIHMIRKKTGFTIAQLRQKLGFLIITKGAYGSTVYAAGQRYDIPAAKPKKVVDPTGAGDSYRAGFLTGILRGYPIDVIGRYAAVSAVYGVEQYGTQTHSFTDAAIARRYAQNFKQPLP